MGFIQRIARYGWIGVIALLAAPIFSGEPKKEQPAKLEAKLMAKKDTYKLDLQGKTPEEFRALVGAAIKDRFAIMPTAPSLEVTLILRNPTDKDIKVIVNPGDAYPDPGMTLELKGPGALAISSPRSPLKFYSEGYAVTIPAGKSVEQGVSMMWGDKRQFHYAYWLEPGDYTLSVRSESKGYGSFVTEPIKLKVTAK